MQPPVMPEDGHTTRMSSGEDVSSPGGGKDSPVIEALWDDEDTRAFYECLADLRFLPDIMSIVPCHCYKNTIGPFKIFMIGIFSSEHLYQQYCWEKQSQN